MQLYLPGAGVLALVLTMIVAAGLIRIATYEPRRCEIVNHCQSGGVCTLQLIVHCNR